MNRECDVLVVGGGPAGVIAAYTVAKEGRSVFLTDEKTQEQIGNKTCGDALGLSSLEFLKKHTGLEYPHGKEVSDVIDTLVLATHKINLPMKLLGFVVDRHFYGQRLLKQAESVGVEILPKKRVLRAYIKNKSVQGAYYKNLENKNEELIKAKVTIDCSGRNFIIRKTMSKNTFPMLEHSLSSDEIVPSYREIIRLKEDHIYHKKYYLIYDNRIPEPGYFWFFSKGPYELNAGIGWKLSAEGKGSNMRKVFKKILHEYYPPRTYKVITAAGYTIPIRYPLLNHVADGFLTAGDAACHVDPSTAEGHGPALVAGYLAGMQAANALEEGKATTNRLWDYNRKIFAEFGINHFKKQLIADTITKLKMDGIDFIFSRKIMTAEEFIDMNEGKRLSVISMMVKIFKMFPRWNYLSKLRALAYGTRTLPLFFKDYPDSPDGYNEWYFNFLSWFNKVRQNFK